MTAMVSAATRSFIWSTSYGTLTSTVGIIAVMLLVLLLLQKELLRAAATRAEAGGEVLNIAILPLLLAFAVIVTLRLVTLWQLQ